MTKNVTVTELKPAVKYELNDFGLTVEINPYTYEIFISLNGYDLHMSKPTLNKNDVLVWFNGSVCICPNESGCISELRPVCSIPNWMYDLSMKLFDVKSCIGCNAYNIATGINELMRVAPISVDMAKKLLGVRD